jgi:hypothetical protein
LFSEGEFARLSWNDDINVELDEHVRHREARDNEAGASGGDASEWRETVL